jgi:hypothetical protein
MSSIHNRAARDQSRTVPNDHDLPTAADLAALDEIGAAIGRCLATDITGWRRAQLWDLARSLGLYELARRDAKRLKLAPPAPGRPLKRTPPREPIMNLVQGGGQAGAQAPVVPGADPWPAAINEVVVGVERGMAMPGLKPDDRDQLLEIRTLARLAGRLPARELRAADPERPPA